VGGRSCQKANKFAFNSIDRSRSIALWMLVDLIAMRYDQQKTDPIAASTIPLRCNGDGE